MPTQLPDGPFGELVLPSPAETRCPTFALHHGERTLSWLFHLILKAEELGSPPWQPVCQHSVLPRQAQLQRVSAVTGTLMNCLAVAPAAKDTDVQDELKGIPP